MKIEMLKVELNTATEESYIESLEELFEGSEDLAKDSFNKNYTPSWGLNINNVVKDAFRLPNIAAYSHELHILGENKLLLIVAYVEKDDVHTLPCGCEESCDCGRYDDEGGTL